MSAGTPDNSITLDDLKGWEGSPTRRPGRTQLSGDFKAQLKKKLAEATGEEEEAFDFRSLNSSAQTTRATSESLGARAAARRNNKTWVFLARVSDSEQKIQETLFQKLPGVCSAAVLFSKADNWAPYSLMYHESHKQLADDLSSCLGIQPDKIRVFDAFHEDASGDAGESSAKIPQDLFLSDAEVEAIIRNLERKKSVILSGPPGTGKTFIADRVAAALLKGIVEQSLTRIQFHPSYSYEEFVRGWRPSQNGFSLADGSLLRIASNASDDPDSRHILIIDEINRANVSKVFGEALSLVEATKRSPEHGVSLSYARSPEDEEDEELPFFLPPNVYIIGTMNTADRSIAMVDFALRRRFSFFYIRPAFDSPKFKVQLEAAGIPNAIVSELCTIMCDLNDAIVNDDALGLGYEVGHSYFVPLGKLDSPSLWLRDVITTEIFPLLNEYWFEDIAQATMWQERLNSVLGLFSGNARDRTENSADATDNDEGRAASRPDADPN